MELNSETYDLLDIDSKIKYVNIKLHEAYILGDKDEFNYWNTVIKSLTEKKQTFETQKDIVKNNNTLEDLKNSVGNTDGYVVLVHGTHLTNDEVQSLIFSKGLKTTNFNEETTLDKTTSPFDISKYTAEEIKERFERYDHNNKNMIVIKLPLEFFNMYDYTGDLDCRKSRAFMKEKVYTDGRYQYLLDPKFIVGSYNTETMLNPSYEKELSVETRKELKEKLISLQKEIGIDPDLIEQINSEEIVEEQIPMQSNESSNNPLDDYQKMVEELETKKDYNYYFNEMLKSTQKYNPNIQMSEEQKKQLIGEIFYNESYLIELLTSDEEIRQIMTRSVNELDSNEMQIRLQNIILTEMQEKYKQLHPEMQQAEKYSEQEMSQNNNNDNLDLSGLIEQLKNELYQVQNAYRSMMSDGYIDDKELPILLDIVNKVINDGYSLKSVATDPKDMQVISVIINSLEEEQKKMKKMQNGIEEIGRLMR